MPAEVKRYTQYEDKELLYLLSQNDKEAFTELYNRFWKKLFAIAYSRMNEVQDAEDMVHDVMASLWINREKVEIDLLENYLATATKYAVLSKIKKKQREFEYQKTLELPVVRELQVEKSLHFKKVLEVIKSEVEQLPERCRLIFKYSREQGKPVKQIAKELNISPKTVENQLNKALKQLRLVAKSFFHSLFSFFL